MKKLFLSLVTLAITTAVFSQSFLTTFETSKVTSTPTYFEIIAWWKKLDQHSDIVKMQTMGMSDAGYPLHLITVSPGKDFSFSSLHTKNKVIILINNGIHPGEPDGIDATMLLVRDIVLKKQQLPSNVVLAIIPVYNIGGCLNRSADFRVDQDGPDEFGSRGNSQNLDLNRDFIKCDSKEARSFTEIFHLTDPDIFIDNHVSNGADYQHVMTLLTTQHNKLGGDMGIYLNKTFEPGIYSLMKQKNYDLIPYVNAFEETPEKGWPEFWDSPRYGSGYAALWNTFSFVPETHMLKSYDKRVAATYALMQSFIAFSAKNRDSIKLVRRNAQLATKDIANFPLRFINDRNVFQQFLYKGFEAGKKPSEVSGLPRLYYDRQKPFEKLIPIYNQYTGKGMIVKPMAYIIPQGWWKVIDLLKLNRVNMQQLKQDTMIEVEVYKITEYKAAPRKFEMHHLNSDVKLSATMEKVQFRKGDWYLPMNQMGNRFIASVLEPQMEDSYFTWNFFDGILNQKEGYSAYVFEDIAADYLKKNPALKVMLETKKQSDTTFAKNGSAQLNFVFQNSPWYEPAHMRYPVYRKLN